MSPYVPLKPPEFPVTSPTPRFLAGKAADNTDDAACIAGTVAGALHVRQVAKLYGVPVTWRAG